MLLRIQGVGKLLAKMTTKLVVVFAMAVDLGNMALRLTRALCQFTDLCADQLDLFVAELNRFHNLVFGDLFCAGLHHHNAVFRTGNHDVQEAFCTLRVCRIDDKLLAHQANSNRADRSFKRQVAQRDGAGGRVDGDHIWIVFLVGGVDKCNHLRLIPVAFIEKRPHGTIDLA